MWAFLLSVRRDLVFKQTLVNVFELVNTIFQIYVQLKTYHFSTRHVKRRRTLKIAFKTYDNSRRRQR